MTEAVEAAKRPPEQQREGFGQRQEQKSGAAGPSWSGC